MIKIDMTLWENKYNEPIHKIRVGCRAIILKGNQVLLSYEARNNRYFIPGGGLEEGETLEEGCIREVAEEAGFIVEPELLFLTVDGYYHDMIYRNHFFFCHITDTTRQNLTDQEAANELVPRFIPLTEAIRIFSQYPDLEKEQDILCESYMRDYRVLKELQHHFNHPESD